MLPVTHGDRTLGAYVLTGDDVRYLPAVDVHRLAAVSVTGVVAVTVAVAGAVAAVRRPPGPAIRTVSMGPGGWISLRGLPAVRPRTAVPARPWWARLLRAHRLTVQR